MRLMMPTRLLRTEWPPNDGLRPGNARFDAILESVRQEGVREPLTINLNWLVIDGVHRLSAARQLGIEWVPVRIWTGTEFLPLRRAAEREGGPMTTDRLRSALASALLQSLWWTHAIGDDEWTSGELTDAILANPAVRAALDDSLDAAVDRAIALLERPHKHDWRPDLVTCGVEQDALGILRAARNKED